EREGAARIAKRNDLRRLPLDFRRRQAEAESMAAPVRSARAHGRIRRHEPRLAAPRIQVCWLDHLLRLDASDRDGQRSPLDLFAPCGTRRRVAAQMTNRRMSA